LGFALGLGGVGVFWALLAIGRTGQQGQVAGGS
jgi:hypothetical protein